MSRGPHVWFLSEHRMRAGAEQGQANAWAKARGLGLFMHAAAPTGDGPLQTSSGTAVAIKGCAMSQVPEWENWVDWALREAGDLGDSMGYESARVRARVLARVCPVRIKGLLRGGFVAVSIHLVDGLRFEGTNGVIFRLLSGFLSQLQGAWVVGGDWNMTPTELGQCGFLSHVGGSVCSTGLITCTSGSGRELDYFVAGMRLSACVRKVERLDTIPTTPHCPVHMAVGGDASSHEVFVQAAPKPLAAAPCLGPRRQRPPCTAQWSWQTGHAPPEPGAAWEEWLGQAEAEWRAAYDLGPEEAKAKLGRRNELRFRSVALAGLAKRAMPPGLPPEALAWRGLLRACTVARGPASRPGWVHRKRWVELVNRLWASIKSDDLTVGFGASRYVALSWELDERHRAAFAPCWLAWLRGAICAEAAAGDGGLLQLVERLQAQVSRDVGRAASAAWRDRVIKLVDVGGAEAYAMARGAEAAAAGACGPPEVGAEAVARELQKWLPLWWQPPRVEEQARVAAAARALAKEAPMCGLTVQRLDEVLRTYGPRTGLGGDTVHPRAILALSRDLRARFVDVLSSWEASMVMPCSWAHKMVVLPKPGGEGTRVIGLTVCPLRVWSRLRQPLAAKWEQDHPDEAFWGTEGRACERGAWVHSVCRDAARGANVEFASTFLDLAKFYEMVGHGVFLQESQAVGFDLHLASCLIGSWGGARFLELEGAVSGPLQCHGSVLAGCSAATTAAKVLVLRLIRKTRLWAPALRVWNVVDDFAMFSAGPSRAVLAAVGQGVRCFTRGLRELALPLSKGKSKLLCSSTTLGQQILSAAQCEELQLASWARNVGVDVGARGRRFARTALARVVKAIGRGKRLAAMRTSGARASKLVAASHNAAATWGCSVLGTQPRVLQSVRASAARAACGLAHGQNAALKLRAAGLAGLDPASRLLAEPIVAWATGIWTGVPGRPLMRLALAGARGAGGRLAGWRQATGVVQGLLLTLRVLGWRLANEGRLISHRGEVMDLARVSPAYVRARAVEAVTHWTERGQVGGAVDAAIDWKAASGLGRGSLGKGWSPLLRSAYLANASSRGWPCTDYSRAQPVCLLCGEAGGGGFHLAYRCPALAARRHGGTSERLRACAARLADGEGREAFARGLFPDAACLAPPGCTEATAEVVWTGTAPLGALTGRIYTDGSAVGVRAGLPRAGYSAVMVDVDGWPIASIHGPVPVDACPAQTVADAEDYALAQLATCGLAPMEIHVDRAQTVAVAQGAEGAALGPASVRAHIWSRFFAAFGGDANVRVTKTLAHSSWEDVRANRVSEQAKRGNDRADALAKAGAAMHGLTAHHLAEVAAARRLAREAARWGAEARLVARSFAAQLGERLARRGSVSSGGSLVVGKRPTTPGGPPGPGQVWAGGEEEDSDGDRPLGHHVGMCKVHDAAGRAQGSLAFCWVCGAYFWKKVGMLSRRCTGRVIRGHVPRIKKGQFPDGNHPGWRVGQVAPPTPPQLWQLRRQLQATAGCKGPAVPAACSTVACGRGAERECGNVVARVVTRAEYLTRLGIDEASLQRWAAREGRCRKAARPAGETEVVSDGSSG